MKVGIPIPFSTRSINSHPHPQDDVYRTVTRVGGTGSVMGSTDPVLSIVLDGARCIAAKQRLAVDPVALAVGPDVDADLMV